MYTIYTRFFKAQMNLFRMIALPFLVVLLGCVGSTAASGSWGYGETRHGVYGPKDWGHVSEYCDASAQSPVNINKDYVKNGYHLRDLQVMFDNKEGNVKGTFVNNGHAPTFKVDKVQGGATLINPANGEKYKLEQFHFHFGCKDNVGSEHTFNGAPTAGELHLVFFNAKYHDLGNAAPKPDGLAVIGAFLMKDHNGNNELASLTRNLVYITNEGEERKNVSVKLTSLVEGLSSGSLKAYFTYKGSLTTPGCYESVRWIVLNTPIKVNERTLERFRTLRAPHGFSGGKMCNNFRPTQPLNGRDIYFHSNVVDTL